ncbi:MAG: DUF58 domain-containing protein [Nitrospirae bacterium]|uniref:DUF58 domain-containing protein n=1 Tax=Candidatus Magnetobacterium casense TaxID=1455061 RepID=UPI0005914942|nr:DUF58 domain-containing protein [Candidatus Magnetobacterium casensis]MBF0336839.1 DUF58 domain-containing protein [Nitrospirota bacterium]
MQPSEVIKNIRRIQITTGRLASDFFCGRYHSVFKGRGIEFDEVRQYLPGDDIRCIDWNVTARMGEPFIKKFVEERELTIMFLLDVSASCEFATVNRFKRAIAAEICSLLALSAVKNNDKVGFVAFSDRVERFIRPAKGLRHALAIVRDAMYFTPQGKGTDIATVMEYLNRVVKRRTITFILSDFYTQGYIKPLSVANRRHDVIALSITDPVELDLPDVGLIELEDAETGEVFLVDTSSKSVRNRYRNDALKRVHERKRILRSINVDHVEVSTNIPYIKTLARFFRMREKRLNR